MPSKVTHFAQQALTVVKEIALVKYITHMSLSGCPPTHQSVLELAENLRKYRRLPNTPSLGIHWIKPFLRRHPKVVLVWTRSINTCRLDGASPEQLAPWFAKMGSLL